MMKKTLSLVLFCCMILSCVCTTGFTASARDAAVAGSGAEAVPSAGDYGLPQNCEDGNILHCFDWTLAQIKAELPHIAEAGFGSVQTSPLQPHSGSRQWYWLYQPNGFSVGNEIGSYDDLVSLCSEAHRYGIKIIVDVVANHVAGSNNGQWSGSVDASLKKSEYYHHDGALTQADQNNRYAVTHKNIGMPDLKSELTYIQTLVKNMLTQLKNAGVDGIRWDAAKHIGLPSEDCAFWSTMSQVDLFQYGEILGDPGGSTYSANSALIEEYGQYMGVTDSGYSGDILNAIKNGTNYKTAGNWNKRGVEANRIVYWGESHDTYSNNANDGGWTKDFDQNLIDKAYAVLGARADSQALYFSRPSQKAKTAIEYGVKGSTHFMSKEVAAINHFHNALVGTEEKFTNPSGNYAVWRTGGLALVSKTSDVDVSLTNYRSMVPAGTYLDEVSGAEWKVTETTVTGHVGASGIAVIYPGTRVKEKLLGDADDNGEIEIVDATFIQRGASGIGLPFALDAAVADADGDQQVTVMDATFIQKWLEDVLFSDKIGKPVTS